MFEFKRSLSILTIALVILVSCTDSETSPSDTPIGEPNYGIFNKRGEDSLVYDKYEPLKDKPITIHYYIPTKGKIENMPILFSMHGAERSGKIQRDAWKYFAEKYHFIVLAPQYTHANGYLENDYQFGAVVVSKNSTVLNDKEKWTYNTIEAIFDYFKSETGSIRERYNIFGHSAGGQFVHRFMLAMPNARVERAVAANPGGWTLPFIDGLEGTDGILYGWPNSVKETPFASEEILKSYLQKKLWVQVGTADTNQNDGMPVDPPAYAQGANRYERGKFFYSESARIAKELGVPYGFQLAEVQGVGHSTLRMVYGHSTAFNPQNVESRGKNCAFSLIFE